MALLAYLLLSTVAGVAFSTFLRSWYRVWRYARQMRAAVDERRDVLPEQPDALRDGVPGEPIALRGRLKVDEGCEPFLPVSTLKALASPDLGVVALSARDVAGSQDVVAGEGARLIVGDEELAFLPSDRADERTRLVLGTFQTQGYGRDGLWGTGLTSYFALSDGDEVWVVARLVREVDADGGGDYRGGPRMRYALSEPMSFYALGEVEVGFRWLPVGAADALGGLVAFMIAMIFIPFFW